MRGFLLEEIILLITINHTGESDIVYSRRCSSLFIQIGLEFPSDRENFLVEIYIFLSLVIFRSRGIGSKLGNKQNNRQSATIWWAVPHPAPLVWIFVYYDTFWYVILGHFTIVVKCRLYVLVQSKAFYTSNIYSWVFTIPCSLGPALFLGLSITLFLFITFIMFVVWMFHVNPIKFPFHIVLGSPIPILAISGNLILWFI